MSEYQLPQWVFELRGRVFTLETSVEFIMAQVDDLTEILTAVATDVDAEVSRVADLETQLKTIQANTPPDIDLTAAIALASSIRQKLETVSDTTTTAAQAQPQSEGAAQV